jgi:acid phosphatase family membrane protein YuiD
MLLDRSESIFGQFSHNQIVIATFFSWLIAQIIKVVLGYVKEKRFDFRWLMRSGGMPSSHVALSMCLATSVGLYSGFDSGLFAVALAFTAITVFDAQGVRRHSGQQAKALNKILEDIYSHKGLQEAPLKQFIGHTPVEVYAGCALGVVIAILFYKGVY